MKINAKYILLFVFILITSSAKAVDPRLHWNTISSQHFYIHYADGYERLAQKTANSAEQAHLNIHTKINWQPLDKTHLVISDETDFSNGYATPVHFNRSVLFMAPPESASGLEEFDDWLETLITHEYTHILHLDKVSGSAEVLRNIFGRQFLLFPNMFQPNWFTEGLATYIETDNEKGIGRGQSSLYKMMMRTEVEVGIKPVDQINLPNRSWPMGTLSYLYGVHFYQFMKQTYGQQGIDYLVENYSDNIIPFMINTNTKQVLDKDVKEIWDDFSKWLTKRYQEKIDYQKSSGLVEGEKITDSGYKTGAVDINDNDEVYYVYNGAFEHAALMQSTGDSKKIISEVHNGAKINVHIESGVLITQNEFCDEYNINSDIYIVENGEDEPRRITRCGRYRSADWSADGESIIAIKTVRARNDLVLLNKQGEIIKYLWKGNETDIVTQLKSSPLGDKIVAAVFRTGNGWNIEEFDLSALEWNAVTKDGYVDMYPSYSDNGKSIIFSSERTGRYEIYLFKKESGNFEQITRVSGGAFEAVQIDRQSALYYVGYNANGYDIFRLEKTKALSTDIMEEDNLHEVVLAPKVETGLAEDYSPVTSLYPRWWFPFISLNEDRNEYGITTSGNDALGLHNYFLNIAYDTNNEWLIGNINYSYTNRFSMGYQRSTDIFRDNTGEFAVARNVDDIFISTGFNDPGIDSRIQYQLAALVSESEDGNRATGIPEQVETRDGLVGAAVIFSNTQNYIRSISASDGRNLRLIAETTEAFESDYSGEVYSLDWREFISLGKQNVLAMRLVQGWGTEEPKPFRLGGEGSHVDVFDFITPISEPLIGRRRYALRGYAEGHAQLSGRRMQLATLEWRFPGSLIERGLMSPPIGLIQWSGSVFAESGAAYENSTTDEYYSSAGLELQAEVNLFYGITSRMRLGVANGFDKSIGEQRVYFDLGVSF